MQLLWFVIFKKNISQIAYNFFLDLYLHTNQSGKLQLYPVLSYVEHQK